MYGALTVTDNLGPGVVAYGGAVAHLGRDTAISGNMGYGVRLELNAAAVFSDGATVTGNQGFDLVCTAGAVAGAAKGDRPVIGRMKCPTWTSQLTPPPAWVQAASGSSR